MKTLFILLFNWIKGPEIFSDEIFNAGSVPTGGREKIVKE